MFNDDDEFAYEERRTKGAKEGKYHQRDLSHLLVYLDPTLTRALTLTYFSLCSLSICDVYFTS